MQSNVVRRQESLLGYKRSVSSKRILTYNAFNPVTHVTVT
jgi:hypothetical protein